jgi:hypothetical protein
MPLQHGVPTIRYKVYAHIKWPGRSHEFVWCGHEHYNASGATRCALKYYNVKQGLVYAPLVNFIGSSGLVQIGFSGEWKPYRGIYSPPTRALTPEEVIAEMRLRKEALAAKDLLK